MANAPKVHAAYVPANAKWVIESTPDPLTISTEI